MFLLRALQPGIDGCELQREVSVFRSPVASSRVRQGRKREKKQKKEGEKLSLCLEELSGKTDGRTQLCGSRLSTHHCLTVARRSKQRRPTGEHSTTQHNNTKPASLHRTETAELAKFEEFPFPLLQDVHVAMITILGGKLAVM